MKKFSVVTLILFLILFTAIVKNSTKRIDDLIFTSRESIRDLKKDFDIIKLIQHLLKDQGMTIKGAKIILKKNFENKLDDNINFSVDKPLKSNLIIKKKILNIKKLINELNKYKNG